MIYSRRRTLSLEVTRSGEAVVRAPRGTPAGTVAAFVSAHRGWLEEHRRRRLAWLAAHPEPTAEEEARLRALAREALPRRVAHFAALMGVEPAGVRITSARTRFGSCSGRNSLCFSWRLMQYPEAAIDYVVVHELAHLVYMDHGPRFYALVASVLPDYLERAKLLK